MIMNRKSTLAMCALVFLSVFMIPRSVKAETPMIYIDPPEKTGLQLGEIFRVNITVANVTNLYAWEFSLYYESELLNASGWSLGPVFTASDLHEVDAIDWTDSYNQTHGLIHIIFTFFGSVQAFNGTATLSTVEFKVKSLGTTVLHLQDTSLLDNSDPWPGPIAHTTGDGRIGETMKGDINRDGQVNIIDISIVAAAFNTKPGEQRWNPSADVDNNGVVNIIDITIVAKEFGKKKP
jgi:hypothetical protein